MHDQVLLPDERIDDLERDGLKLIQNAKWFRYGVDAVLLSWFARAKEGETVLDLCTGTGVIPILMTAKTKAKSFTGLEIQEAVAEMARRSVALNHLEEKVHIECGDVKEASVIFGGASFDVVTVNPPYLTAGGGISSPDHSRAVSRQEVLCTLKDVLRESAKVLRPGGRFYMVHRPFRL
ncbi:MAG: methyltransferase, partial [Parasporobacterium sp.]|nr:methyltransferase [Parasporobacterium sp.]